MPASRSWSCHLKVHPRVCGVHSNASTSSFEASGSSPRVRGSSIKLLPPQLPTRFIPACAGFMDAEEFAEKAGPVHPRVCGVHSSRIPVSSALLGSSPRVRGSLTALPLIELPFRFIPACAGFICCSAVRRLNSAVHPRVCGVHNVTAGTAIAGDGSSPRVRGSFFDVCIINQCQRFIPACAGFIFDRRRGGRL